MPDYREQTPHYAGGDVVTPLGLVRNDPGGDLATANLNRVMGQVGPDGGLKVNAEGANPTFCWSVIDLPIASAATDLVILNGSASKTVKILRIEAAVSGATGINGVADLTVQKRTTANTGGTTTTTGVAVAKFDSSDGAATAAFTAYTANPSTLGTAAGLLAVEKLAYATPGATIGPAGVDAVIWPFADHAAKAGGRLPTLRGTAEGLAINANGSTFGGSSTISIAIWGIEVTNTV